MYCNYCGAKLPDDSKFCSNCGKQIKIVDDIKEKAVWCNFEDTNSKQEEVAEIYDPHEFANEIREKVRRHEEQEAERLKQEERNKKKREKERERKKREKEVEAFLENDLYYQKLNSRENTTRIIFFLLGCLIVIGMWILYFKYVFDSKESFMGIIVSGIFGIVMFGGVIGGCIIAVLYHCFGRRATLIKELYVQTIRERIKYLACDNLQLWQKSLDVYNRKLLYNELILVIIPVSILCVFEIIGIPPLGGLFWASSPIWGMLMYACAYKLGGKAIII